MLDKYFSLKKEISKNEELHNLNSRQASYNIGALFIAFSTVITLVFFFLLKNQIISIHDFFIEVNNSLSPYYSISLKDKSINEVFAFFSSGTVDILSESTLAKYHDLKNQLLIIIGTFIAIKSFLCIAHSNVKNKILNKYGFNIENQDSSSIFSIFSGCFMFFWAMLLLVSLILLDSTAKPLALINVLSVLNVCVALITCVASFVPYSVTSGKFKDILNYESNIKKLDKERIIVFNKMSNDNAFLNAIAEKASNDELNDEEIKIVDNIFETVRLRDKKKKEATDRGLKYKKIIKEDLSLKEFDEITITNQ
jgi:hypothetical protein